MTALDLTSALLMSSPTGSLPQQLITRKNEPHTKSVPHIAYPVMEPSEPEVIRNMNEQNISKKPRPLVVLRNKKFLRINSKSQNEITIRKPKKLRVSSAKLNLHLVKEESKEENDL